MSHPIRWLEDHSLGLIGILAVVIALFGAVSIWDFFQNEQQGDQLRGVKSAGPCRAFGIKNPECRRQARLIVRACLTQPDCRKRLDTLNRKRGSKDEPQDSRPQPSSGRGEGSSGGSGPNGGSGGGGSVSPPPPPPSPGPPSPPGTQPPSPPKPPNPPPPPSPPGPPKPPPPQKDSILGTGVQTPLDPAVCNLPVKLCQ